MRRTDIVVFSWCCALSVAVSRASTADSSKQTSDALTGSDHCQCQMFIQSWKTSHMIRLPVGIEPIEMETASTDACLSLCQSKFPAKGSAGEDDWWTRLYKRACRTLLANEYQTAHKRQQLGLANGVLDSSLSGADVRGCLQGYARSSDTHIWVPMGVDYRRVLSCPHPVRLSRRKQRQGRGDERSISNKGSGNNKQSSIDAQLVVSAEPDELSHSPPPAEEATDGTKRPLVLNLAPLKATLKQAGLYHPYVESVLTMVNKIGLRELLERFEMGSYIDRYHRIYDDYTEELDAGHCFLEYAAYTLFNNRFALKNVVSSVSPAQDASGSRGFEETAFGLVAKLSEKLLESESAPQILTAIMSLMPSSAKKINRPSTPLQSTDSTPDVQIQELAKTIARYYIRNHLATLSGSTVQVDRSDPTNNPDTLADMVEQVSRPVFLSIFGVVPGVPASGRLDHLLATKKTKTAVASATQSRNKLVPLDPHRQPQASMPTVVKTGNAFYDFGNSIVATFMRASDASHGLYCAKQYAVNKLWDRFRGAMRRMMRAIPVNDPVEHHH